MIQPQYLAAYYEKLLRLLQPFLLPELYRNQLINIAHTLPPLRHGMIELYDPPLPSRTDLMIGVLDRLEEQKLLANWPNDPTTVMPEGWPLIREFCSHWSDTSHLMSSVVETIYIVYDNADGGKKVPNPWFYLTLRNLHLGNDSQVDLFMRSASFFPGSLTKQTRHLLHDCFQALQDDQRIFGFSLLSARGQEDVAFCVQ